MSHIYNRPDDIYAWNAVDVQDERTGLLQHGRVVNAVSNGLIVDLDCEGRRAELLPHSAVFHCHRRVNTTFYEDSPWGFHRDISEIRRQRVEVLAREQANRPWTWYPAEIIYPRLFWQRYVFLAIQLGESRVIRQMMRAHPVRLRDRHTSSFEREIRAIVPASFVAQGQPLPADYWGVRDEPVAAPLWEAWKEAVSASQHGIWPVCVLGKMVVFLQGTKEKDSSLPLQPEQMEELMSAAKQRLAQRSVAAPTPSPSVQRPCSPPEHEALPGLPAEIWEEILHLLDSAQRAQCRRVCPLWNELLQQPGQDVLVSFAHQRGLDKSGRVNTPHETEWRRSAYMVGLSLWQCVGAGTQRIIIRNASHRAYCNQALPDCLRLIECIHEGLQPPTGKALTLILHKCHWDVGNLRENRLECSVPGVKVIWKDCSFSGPSRHFCRQPIAYGVSAAHAQGTAAFRVLAASLPDPGEAELARLSRWLADAASEGADPDLRQRIDRVLSSCQTWYNDADCYLEDSIDEFDVEHTFVTLEEVQQQGLAGLSKLTLCALQREMDMGDQPQPDSTDG
ncbi:uncharacterized protein LOC129601700 [Paramacrobiotus metropolitanus]|uniref:uncharacterized protein LOC129601700 n=1 Tax=Paramacrobiotus metropolitanus TaxID=2943436 RepID=UPI002445B2C0|nr:uncharacterized protein LOC129601700 [Paramacrobiotus metropolitanus]